MFGHRITKWEEDGLIGAFGARAIVESGKHTDYYSRLDFVYDRQSVVGTEFGKKAIHVMNKQASAELGQAQSILRPAAILN